MNKLYFFVMLSFFALVVKGQDKKDVRREEPYGHVSIADLQMTACDFEKDANAEVLFDKVLIHSGAGLNASRHIRIKIFNDFGKNNADIRLAYHTGFGEFKSIAGVEGQTINLDENGAIKITPLSSSQIFIEKINRNISEVVFTLPNVKAGSIIEYQYRSNPSQEWFFQGSLPTRYSEIEDYQLVGYTFHINQPLVVNEVEKNSGKRTWAMANLHSLPDEPYMTARKTNLQRVDFRSLFFGSWEASTPALAKLKGFGLDLDEPLPGEDVIVKKAAQLPNDEERTAFIFDTVKSCMRWDNIRSFFTVDNIKTSWKKKAGNSADLNLIVYHLLKASGINATPMITCTRDFGRMDRFMADPFSVNNTVVFVPGDNGSSYVLDASNKFNLYNTIPSNILNSYGVSIDIGAGQSKVIALQDTLPVLQTVVLGAEVLAGGKMVGNVEITNNSYGLVNAVSKYKTYGEEKYLDTLRKLDNNISITSFKMENAGLDVGPLSQKFDFSINLNSSDEQFIYFNTNLFTQLEDNPFTSETRYSDIDLSYRNNFAMSGVYKIPAGYKVVGLPKSITTVMPDASILFKRTVIEDNGSVLVRYTINHRATVYYIVGYQDLRGFYKKMYELLNEQIILKKI